jgi:hypothetical protein
MKLADATDAEIEELRNQYRLSLRTEDQASVSVRRMWKIIVLALDDVLARRFNGGVRTVLDATKMVWPGNEPLA